MLPDVEVNYWYRKLKESSTPFRRRYKRSLLDVRSGPFAEHYSLHYMELRARRSPSKLVSLPRDVIRLRQESRRKKRNRVEV